jgi:hypothetical protein
VKFTGIFSPHFALQRAKPVPFSTANRSEKHVHAHCVQMELSADFLQQFPIKVPGQAIITDR